MSALSSGEDERGCTFVYRTELNITPGDLWSAVSNMAGVNRELAPYIQMTVPARARDKTLSDVPLGERAFISVILLFGVLPIDLHFLRLEQRTETGFVERSSSLLQRLWRHERRIEPAAQGAVISDRITYRSRVPGLDWLLLPIMRAVFAHRHRRLLARYGARPSQRRL